MVGWAWCGMRPPLTWVSPDLTQLSPGPTWHHQLGVRVLEVRVLRARVGCEVSEIWFYIFCKYGVAGATTTLTVRVGMGKTQAP